MTYLAQYDTCLQLQQECEEHPSHCVHSVTITDVASDQ